MTANKPLVLASLSDHAQPSRVGKPDQCQVTMAPNPLEHPGLMASLQALAAPRPVAPVESYYFRSRRLQREGKR